MPASPCRTTGGRRRARMSARSNPYENARVERCFTTLKREEAQANLQGDYILFVQPHEYGEQGVLVQDGAETLGGNATLGGAFPTQEVEGEVSQHHEARRPMAAAHAAIYHPRGRLVLAVYSIRSDLLAVRAQKCRYPAPDGVNGQHRGRGWRSPCSGRKCWPISGRASRRSSCRMGRSSRGRHNSSVGWGAGPYSAGGSVCDPRPILALLAAGKPDTAIAHELWVAVRTVKNLSRALYRRLPLAEVGNPRTAAAVWYLGQRHERWGGGHRHPLPAPGTWHSPCVGGGETGRAGSPAEHRATGSNTSGCGPSSPLWARRSVAYPASFCPSSPPRSRVTRGTPPACIRVGAPGRSGSGRGQQRGTTWAFWHG